MKKFDSPQLNLNYEFSFECAKFFFTETNFKFMSPLMFPKIYIFVKKLKQQKFNKIWSGVYHSKI